MVGFGQMHTPNAAPKGFFYFSPYQLYFFPPRHFPCQHRVYTLQGSTWFSAQNPHQFHSQPVATSSLIHGPRGWAPSSNNTSNARGGAIREPCRTRVLKSASPQSAHPLIVHHPLSGINPGRARSLAAHSLHGSSQENVEFRKNALQHTPGQ